MNTEKTHGKFIKPVSLKEALELAMNSFSIPINTKIVDIREALGMILAEDILSPIDIPSEDRSFYDGFALRSDDAINASPQKPAILAIKERGPIDSGEAVSVGAGMPVPEGADSIARAEICEVKGKILLVKAPVLKGENVIRKGGDLKKGDVALEKGKILRPQDIALAMELGISSVKVHERTKIAIMHVGNEILKKKRDGVAYPESFSRMVQLMLESFGFETTHLGIFPEDFELFRKTVLEALEQYDALVIVGRASIGEDDFVPRALSEIGSIVFHGVGVSPGKVSGLALVREKPVYIVPAHVGSAMASLLLIVIPSLTAAIYGSKDPYFKLRARLQGEIEGRAGLAAFRTVNVKREGGDFLAYPISKEYGGSPFLTSLTRANGFLVLEPNSKLNKGELVEVRLFSPLELLPLSLFENGK